MIEAEWENYVANLAFERIHKAFSGKAIQVFEKSLEGKSVEEIAIELDLQEDSVYKLKNRVKRSLQKEINFLREDLS